nr:hypothetical protein GCM10020185_43110 [Pseudomonas brassicacearum subsp. brassicacearum]
MAAADPRLVGITPAMKEGSDLVAFSERYPQRYFDVAIAEQHAVTLAAGMACEGAKPVVAIYSTFLQRAYDQLIHDVAVQNLDVLFAIDRAGLVGEDGPTHAGSFDLSFLRCIPGMLVMTPSDENELRKMLTTGHLFNGPAAVRYPRGTGPNATISTDLEPIEIGKGVIRRQGKHTALLVFGVQLAEALKVAETLDATVVDMRFVKPLDEALVREMAGSHDLLVTLEEKRHHGRRRCGGQRIPGPGKTSSSRCCTWACRTAMSNTPSRRRCSPNVGWTRWESKRRCASGCCCWACKFSPHKPLWERACSR